MATIFCRIAVIFSLVIVSANAFSQANIPAYIPADGLVAWYPFSGNTIDSSGTGNNGYGENLTAEADRFGHPGSAYSFNGGNSKIEIADAPGLRVRKLTVSVWVKSNIASLSTIVMKGTLNGGNGEAFALNSTGLGIKVNSNCVPGAGWRGVNFSQNITTGNWLHLVGVYDGAQMTVYKNGELDATFPYAGLIDSCIGGGVRIGLNNSFSGNYFEGIIDDVGIWNRALNSTEIAALYNAATDVTGYIGINTADPKRNLHVNDVLRLEPRSFAPANPGKGDMYFDATLNKLRVFDGTVWQNCW